MTRLFEKDCEQSTQLMWAESDLASDLAKISQGDFTSLSVLHMDRPSDISLLYRFNLVTLLALFKANNFDDATNHANAFLPSVMDYLSSWTSDFFDPGIPSPPFDLMVLCCILSNTPQSNQDLLISLYRHYQNISHILTSFDPSRQILIPDVTLTKEQLITAGKAKAKIDARINFLAEVVCSTLCSYEEYSLAMSFMKEFAPANKSMGNQTLMFLGTCALSCGSKVLSEQYFSAITDPGPNEAIKGYNSLFEGDLKGSFAHFSSAPIAFRPSDLSACKKRLGEFDGDLSEISSLSKKMVPELRSQWPLPPKVNISPM